MRLMVRLGILLKRTPGPSARRVGGAALCTVAMAVCAVALAACGSHAKPTKPTTTTAGSTGPTKHDHTVYIYSSLPLRGPRRSESLQIEKGIEFALRRDGKGAPPYQIRYGAGQRLDDTAKPVAPRRGRANAKETSSKPTGTGWSAGQTLRNAEKAASNPQTVAYVGDLDSGATELSVPILNQAGIVQLTPGSGYPGLTDSYNSKYKINQQSDEPYRYYPQSPHTLLRMIPSDIVQAAAVLKVLSGTGCSKFSAWEFGEDSDATALFNAVIATASKYLADYKLLDIKAPPLPKGTTPLVAYVHALALLGVHCAVLVGHVTPQAAALTWELHEQLPPSSPIVGTSGFCSSSWLQEVSKLHGVSKADSKAVAAVLYCTTPALPLSAYTSGRQFSGRQFQRLFENAYHSTPSAYDYYGYVAANLVIGALRDLGPGEDPRAGVATNIVNGLPSSDLGLFDYSFDRGDLVGFATYGVDDFVGGSPRLHGTVKPSPLLPSAG